MKMPQPVQEVPPRSSASLYVKPDHPLAKAKLGAVVKGTLRGKVKSIEQSEYTQGRVSIHLEDVEHAGKVLPSGDLICPGCGASGAGPYCVSCGERMRRAKT